MNTVRFSYIYPESNNTCTCITCCAGNATGYWHTSSLRGARANPADRPEVPAALHVHNRLSRPQKRDRGLAIYLDVSGSVNEYLPQILGILKTLGKEITTTFQFSNRVVETSFETLLKGNIQTTFGTDFNCIAQSILERGFDKAVIITDGYASMSDELKEQLKKHGLVTLTILFGDAQTCEDFAQFGEVLLLEHVTH